MSDSLRPNESTAKGIIATKQNEGLSLRALVTITNGESYLLIYVSAGEIDTRSSL
jgi:hypothetical protein